MASEKPETGGFLATIEAKIAALQRLAESYRQAVSLGALGPAEEGAIAGSFASGTMGGSYDLPAGALLGKSIPAAIKIYLSAVKKKQTLKEIVTALREGGIESTANSFDNTVGASLTRLRASGDVLRFKDGWALAEFYPENLRNRIVAKETKPRSRKRKTTRAKSQAVVAKADATPRPNDQSIDQRIESLFRHQSGQRFSPKQVASAIGSENPKAVNMAVARLAGRGKIVKGSDGLYGASATH